MGSSERSSFFMFFRNNEIFTAGSLSNVLIKKYGIAPKTNNKLNQFKNNSFKKKMCHQKFMASITACKIEKIG